MLRGWEQVSEGQHVHVFILFFVQDTVYMRFQIHMPMSVHDHLRVLGLGAGREGHKPGGRCGQV